MNSQTPQKSFQAVVAPVSRTLDHTSTRVKTSNLTKLETRIGQLLALTHALKPSSYWLFSARLKSCPDTKQFFEIGSKQTELDISFAVTNKARSLKTNQFFRSL